MTKAKARKWLTALVLGWVCAATGAVEPKLQDCTDCPAMVVIPAGTFKMGDARDPSTSPEHQVTIAYSFALGQTEVTEVQFRFFLGRTGYDAGSKWKNRPVAPKRPAVDLDRYAAEAYVRWLSRYTGKVYRLPSETEWDYAAHAGRSTRFWWGDVATDGCGKEYSAGNSSIYGEPCASDRGEKLADVASLVPNPWGLYDMMGNAEEWVADCPPRLKNRDPRGDYSEFPTDGSSFIADTHRCDIGITRGPSVKEPWPRNHLQDPAFNPHAILPIVRTWTGFRVLRELP